MSRTYKDQPDWVKANRTGKREINHYGCEHDSLERTKTRKLNPPKRSEAQWHQRRVIEKKKHTWADGSSFTYSIDRGLKWVYDVIGEDEVVYITEPLEHECDLKFDREHGTWRARLRGHYCTYSLDYDQFHYRWYNVMPKEARREYYHSERTEVRDTLKRAKDEYNYCGETYEEPYSRSNAKGLYGGGWYW